MVPKVKKQWVKALRSGKYKQGKGVLHRKDKKVDSYCCFGVLCDVLGYKWTKSVLQGGVMRPKGMNEPTIFGIVQYACSSYISTELREKLEIKNEEENKLLKMNDRGVKFPKIADWIEKNL